MKTNCTKFKKIIINYSRSANEWKARYWLSIMLFITFRWTGLFESSFALVGWKDSINPLARLRKDFRDAGHAASCRKHNAVLCQGNIVRTHFSHAYYILVRILSYLFTAYRTCQGSGSSRAAIFIYAFTLISIYAPPRQLRDPCIASNECFVCWYLIKYLRVQ